MEDRPCVLVTGPFGQIGTELVAELLRRGRERVLCLAHQRSEHSFGDSITVVQGDARDAARMREVCSHFGVSRVFHLAGVLSAVGERNPEQCWSVNVDALRVLLALAEELGFALFFASSIAVFGPDAPRVAPQDAALQPTSMYGVTKVAGEALCHYYAHTRGVDVRGLRYPGLLSATQEPGGGTTDWACHIFKQAARVNRYDGCFLRADSRLPLQSMADAVRATLELMDAPAERLRHRVYNVAGFSATPQEVSALIAQLQPGFSITYTVDPLRQRIADSWPDALCDDAARADWGWAPRDTLEPFAALMLRQWRERGAQ